MIASHHRVLSAFARHIFTDTNCREPQYSPLSLLAATNFFFAIGSFSTKEVAAFDISRESDFFQKKPGPCVARLLVGKMLVG
jgi:hypothetical protein